MRHEVSSQQDTMPLRVVDHITRILEIQKAIDPDEKLPKVHIEQTPVRLTQQPPYVRQRFSVVHNDVTVVGETVVESDPCEKSRWIDYMRIDRNLQGRGFDTAIYLHFITKAMVDSYSFRTHFHSETEQAKTVWEDLANKGVARVITEFTPQDEGSFTGHYIVDSPRAVAQWALAPGGSHRLQ